MEQKNDTAQGFYEYYTRPLDGNEKAEFVSWLEKHSFDVWLKFKKHHIIYEDDFRQIDVRVIKNHIDLVQKALCDYGYSYELDIVELGNRHFAIIDKNRNSANYEKLMRQHFNE